MIPLMIASLQTLILTQVKLIVPNLPTQTVMDLGEIILHPLILFTEIIPCMPHIGVDYTIHIL